jgi:hypothetical protein
MSWYRKIDVRMHGDKRYRALSNPQPNGKTLWNYLLTGPHTSDGLPGLYPVGRAELAERLGWDLKAFNRIWDEVSKNGTDTKLPMAFGDWECHVVWIPNSVHYNPPESPNVVRGWAKSFDLIPECDLRTYWATRMVGELQLFGEPYVKAFGEAFPEAFAEALAKPLPKALLNPQPQPQPQPQEVSAATLPLEASPAASEAVLMMPVKTGEYPVTKAMLGEWLVLYGNIDVLQTLKKMRGHWLSKPLSGRKTARGIKTSINTWLGKDSDRARGVKSGKLTTREMNEQIMTNAMKGK